MDRRDFIKAIIAAGGLFALAEMIEVFRPGTPPEESMLATQNLGTPPSSSTPRSKPQGTPTPSPQEKPSTSEAASVALVKSSDRAAGVRKAIEMLGDPQISGKIVALKPNFNSADPAPGSTHEDALSALVTELKRLGAQRIIVGDRSGMGETRAVMRQKGIFDMGKTLGFEAIVLDELPSAEWQAFRPQSSHWQRGFYIAKLFAQAESVVQLCNLKTHRFGGHFTMSLKNTVGMAARRVPGIDWDFMRELHSSPYQRLMIAELNVAYKPDMVIMDAIEAFADGGPDVGRRVWPEAVLASTDRIAIDAVGVAILRMFGTTPEVSRGPIFKQEQIARAVELGLGIDSPRKIKLITADAESRSLAARIEEILHRDT